MWKKITGVHDDNNLEQVRDRARNARAEFQSYVSHYADLRQEYLRMKQDNELEREELKREERMAKSFKFTKMSKKVPFLPSLHQKGQLEEGVTSIDKDVKYSDDRDKVRLIQPDRIKDNTKKFDLVSTQKLGYIGKPVGQEFDTYDEVMKHYMRKQERGMIRPKKDGSGQTIAIAASTAHLPGTKGVWTPNGFFPNLLSTTKPLLDRTHTPRGAKRAITLERNFAREKWLYNKKDLDDFDPAKSKRDIDRCKNLKRISRRQEKQRTLRESFISSRQGSSSPKEGQNTMNHSSARVSR